MVNVPLPALGFCIPSFLHVLAFTFPSAEPCIGQLHVQLQNQIKPLAGSSTPYQQLFFYATPEDNCCYEVDEEGVQVQAGTKLKVAGNSSRQLASDKVTRNQVRHTMEV